MRGISLVLLVIMAASAQCTQDEKPFYKLEEAQQLFEQFVKEHDKKYKDKQDEQVHFEAFKQTLQFINEENAKNLSYTLGITLWADLTEEERKEKFGKPFPSNSRR